MTNLDLGYIDGITVVEKGYQVKLSWTTFIIPNVKKIEFYSKKYIEDYKWYQQMIKEIKNNNKKIQNVTLNNTNEFYKIGTNLEYTFEKTLSSSYVTDAYTKELVKNMLRKSQDVLGYYMTQTIEKAKNYSKSGMKYTDDDDENESTKNKGYQKDIDLLNILREKINKNYCNYENYD